VAGYTVQNLKDVENQGVRFGLDENDIQLRMGKDPLESEHCGISYVRLRAGWRTPFGHTHNQQEEIYVLVNGSARMKVEDEVIDMQPFTAVRVSPDTMRAYEGGPEGAELVVIGAPKTGPGDADITPNWWNAD
jgi:quercetin dioxygenase-like cupin family protein